LDNLTRSNEAACNTKDGPSADQKQVEEMEVEEKVHKWKKKHM
jgi:hypothetical protein